MTILFAYDGSESADAAIAAAARGRGNIEGTPARACASTRGYSFSTDSFDFRDFRARCFPCLPSLPASSLDGKEGVDLRPRPTAARVFGLIARSLPT
jgi:hypothetical protein